jgi:hypothetical protein
MVEANKRANIKHQRGWGGEEQVKSKLQLSRGLVFVKLELKMTNKAHSDHIQSGFVLQFNTHTTPKFKNKNAIPHIRPPRHFANTTEPRQPDTRRSLTLSYMPPCLLDCGLWEVVCVCTSTSQKHTKQQYILLWYNKHKPTSGRAWREKGRTQEEQCMYV